jgi:cell division protein FtsI (penicillin-binding protein 3)
VLRPRGKAWYDVETAEASFGQGVSVTTMQLAMAMSAIANGGKLLEPILVERVTDGAGQVVRESAVHVRREVVPAGVARTLAEMLTAVTEPGGTATQAAIPGFRVAGKTSTAQKFDPATGKYSADNYTSAFVGFVPVEHPRIVVAIMLDEPTMGHLGGEHAGPVFRRVAEATLRYLGVTPASGSAKIAEVTRDGDPADAMLAAMKPPAPPAPPAAPAGAPMPPAQVPAGSVRVPDATGLAAHEVVASLTKAGLVPRLEGWGRAVRQEPAPGTAAPKGAAVRVVLEPAS